MGLLELVELGAGVGTVLSLLSGTVASVPFSTLGVWRTDAGSLFLGNGGVTSISLRPRPFHRGMVVAICDAAGLGADSGAYMFGRLFGRRKLAPKVSPGKTWEGFIGGLCCSAVIAWGFSRLAPLTVSSETLIICAVIATLASVLGDLTESMFKREAGIKDSGQLIPGHGGILDRIDSLTAAVPVFACLLLLVFHIA